MIDDIIQYGAAADGRNMPADHVNCIRMLFMKI